MTGSNLHGSRQADDTHSVGAAFFDVDETLISLKSMQSFLDYYFASDSLRGTPWQCFQKTIEGLPREEGNRAYYRLWEGQRLTELAEAGRTWFEIQTRRDDFFIGPAIDAFVEHRRAGRRVFLVSGSFHPCLDPLADRLGATGVFCTELVERAGALTGDIVQSRIGEGKRLAVEEALATCGIRHVETWAYGDHLSDLPMLHAVRHPVAVRPEPQLKLVAEQNNWTILPARATLSEATWGRS